MFKKISHIKNMGVFDNFDWDNKVRDQGNNIAEFKETNIFYGRNYSGKTTLSRIFRAIEGTAIEGTRLPKKCENLEFTIKCDNGIEISRNSLDELNEPVRVFNEDFIKEKLRFLIDEEQGISSFAVLGEDNTRIEREIENIESELGSEDKGTGLYGELKNANRQWEEARVGRQTAESFLKKKLQDKARDIKGENSQFGDVNYDIAKIKTDIEKIQSESYLPIDSNKKNEFENLLRDEKKEEIPISSDLNLKFETLALRTKNFIEKRISISEPIQELLENAKLQKWVEEGQELHKNERDSCGFCGNPLPEDLWDKLNKHFNEESKQLKEDIAQLITEIESEVSRGLGIPAIEEQNFYSRFRKEIIEIKSKVAEKQEKYSDALTALKNQLETRKDNITNHMAFRMPSFDTDKSLSVYNRLTEIVEENNGYSSELESRKAEAKKFLRLNEVHKFIVDIQYDTEQEKISNLKSETTVRQTTQQEISKKVQKKREKIKILRNQLKDESNGAELINNLLGNFFGYPSLSLVAVKNEDDSPSQYRFEIRRGEERAFNLSEGECGLIAFCYFIAKLDDVETKDTKPIIWIDDPVSSLDSNHIFFIFSLIDSEIVRPKKYRQLFISTHNLDFLKYLKRISKDYIGEGKNKRKIREFFLIERKGETSTVSVMPKYMKEYITEFNYLFHQIYKCAKTDMPNDENHQNFYNFGNNARKFLEIFLFYRYPNMGDTSQKLSSFFGEDRIPKIITERMSNEYSHLAGNLERGSQPIEATVSEMHKGARLILSEIKNHDEEQYRAFLESIGEKDIL